MRRGAGRTVRSCILEVYFVRGLGTYHCEAYLEPRNAPLLPSASKARISRLA